MGFARCWEAACAVACLFLIVARYRRRGVIIGAGDMILWTVTVFLVVPLFLDADNSIKTFAIYSGLNAPYHDSLTRVLAASGILIAVWILVLASNHAERATTSAQAKPGPAINRRFWLAIAFLPLVAVLLSPHPSLYRHPRTVQGLARPPGFDYDTRCQFRGAGGGRMSLEGEPAPGDGLG